MTPVCPWWEEVWARPTPPSSLYMVGRGLDTPYPRLFVVGLALDTPYSRLSDVGGGFVPKFLENSCFSLHRVGEKVFS